MDDDEGLFAPHGKGVGIGGGVLLDIEGRGFDVEDGAGIGEQLVEVGELLGADEDAGGDVVEVEDFFGGGAEQAADGEVEAGELFEGLGGLAIEGMAEVICFEA